MKPIRTIAALGLVVATTVAACGARTGLPVWDYTSTDDAGVPVQCVELDAKAQHSMLDVFVMLDTSGSMGFTTSDGETKAKAVRDALAEFFADPDSTGLGVGEAFFPIQRVNVPANCVSDTDCGEPGACYRAPTRVCLPSGQQACISNLDCQGSDKCLPVGACADDAQKLCIMGQASQYCNPGVECTTLGSCLNRTSCTAGDYASLVVNVGTLPGARAKLLLGLDTRTPHGSTPTLPALEGAISAAGAWQDSHAGDKAIVLLATDGLPTACDAAISSSPLATTAGVPHVVDAAKAGVADGVQTYVVGVFSAQEKLSAQSALGQIAQGGGTDHAFVVSTSSNVSSQLVATFNKIRNQADECEYSIPWPQSGGIDPLSLSVTAGGAPVARVGSASTCDPVQGGFYFDRDPAPGVLPHRVILCPATCGSNPPDSVHMQGQCSASP